MNVKGTYMDDRKWGVCYRYYPNATWERYPIPEIESGSGSWDAILESAGFGHYQMFGDGAYDISAKLYDHDKHGTLVDVWGYGEGLASVICCDPPSLLCFLRDFAPLFNLSVSGNLNDIIATVRRTLFDEALGLDIVREVSRRNNERRAHIEQKRAQSMSKD